MTVRLDKTLTSRLREQEVVVDKRDPNTLLLRGVPTNPRFFNKERTNLILVRSKAGGPYLVCVDDDLEYRGEDKGLARAFSDGPIQAGWRAIFVPTATRDLQRVVDLALAALGFESSVPRLPDVGVSSEIARQGRLADLGVELCTDETAAEITVGRENESNAAAATVLKWGQVRLPIIVGESGVGKTNLVHAVARKLKARDAKLRVVAVDVAALFAGLLFPSDRDAAIAALLEEAQATPALVLVLERIDLANSETGLGDALLAKSADAGLRMIGTALPSGLGRLRAGPLGRRLHVVRLSEPTSAETLEILQAIRARLGEHHGLDVEESCIRFCASASHELNGCSPAKAINLLDTACALARIAGADVVGPDDICRAVAGIRAEP
jgi:hypothetical protein